MPLHGYDFDLTTGLSRYDATERVMTYPARQNEDGMEIDADAVPRLLAWQDAAPAADPLLRRDPAAAGADGTSAPRGVCPVRSLV